MTESYSTSLSPAHTPLHSLTSPPLPWVLLLWGCADPADTSHSWQLVLFTSIGSNMLSAPCSQRPQQLAMFLGRHSVWVTSAGRLISNGLCHADFPSCLLCSDGTTYLHVGGLAAITPSSVHTASVLLCLGYLVLRVGQGISCFSNGSSHSALPCFYFSAKGTRAQGSATRLICVRSSLKSKT